MNELAYVDGAFCALSEARVSVEDRGLQFGDSVYEVIVTYGGRPFLLEEHLARLKRSCDAIDLSFDFNARPIKPIIEEGLKRTGLTDAMIYLQITRGVAPRAHVIPPGVTPSLILTFKPRPSLPQVLRERGARVMSTPEIRWAKCFIKSTTLLPNILARHEAIKQGFDDALFVAADGEVRECTSANVFVVDGGALLMPQLTEAVLHGVTQKFLELCAGSIGIPTRQEAVRLEAFRAADEAFMCSTVGEVLGITSLDDDPIGDGRVGAITQRIYAEFRRRARGD